MPPHRHHSSLHIPASGRYFPAFVHRSPHMSQMLASSPEYLEILPGNYEESSHALIGQEQYVSTSSRLIILNFHQCDCIDMSPFILIDFKIEPFMYTGVSFWNNVILWLIRGWSKAPTKTQASRVSFIRIIQTENQGRTGFPKGNLSY